MSTVLRYLDFWPGLGLDLRDIAAQCSPIHTHTRREPCVVLVLVLARARVVCCDISRQEANLGSKQAISQHTGRGFCGFLRLVWLVGLLGLLVREGAECAGATMRQCGKPRSTGERGGAWRGVAVQQQAKAGWLRLRLRGGQAGSNPGLGAAGDVVDRKALGL